MSILNFTSAYFPLVFPFSALMLSFLKGKQKRNVAAGILGLGCLIVFCITLFNRQQLIHPFHYLLSSLVMLVGFIVFRFSLRYMRGSCNYRLFFGQISGLLFLLCLMINTDKLLVFALAFFSSNLMLCRLMNHHGNWSASKHSSRLAFTSLTVGSLFLFLAVLLIVLKTGSHSFSQMIHSLYFLSTADQIVILSSLFFSAMLQSAIWPFHRWIISSLNAPTPVSALMHAGMINGGGILIIKFFPLFQLHADYLLIIFSMGAISAFIGNHWMLIQSSIKRQLACSTLAQMGFMMMQCGLGLLSAATAHLVWHGLYKAYQFFASGSAIEQQKISSQPKSIKRWLLSFPAGISGAAAFVLAGQKEFGLEQANLILIIFAFIASAQLGQNLLSHRHRFISFMSGLLFCFAGGICYGLSIRFIERLVPDISAVVAVQLSPMHFILTSLFILNWAFLASGASRYFKNKSIWHWLYVRLLNSSQPHGQSISMNKSDYQLS